MTPKAGDLLVIWNMPWLAVSVIDWASNSQPAHHCSLVLPAPTWWVDAPGRLYVYEAWKPRSRFMTWDEYERQMGDWASDWRYRQFGRPAFKCKLWRFPDLDPVKVERLHAAAEALLDIRYNMVANWAVGTPAINCSELFSRATVAAHMTERSDYLDGRGDWLPLDKATPWQCEQGVERHSAELQATYDGQTWWPKAA